MIPPTCFGHVLLNVVDVLVWWSLRHLLLLLRLLLLASILYRLICCLHRPEYLLFEIPDVRLKEVLGLVLTTLPACRVQIVFGLSLLRSATLRHSLRFR